MAEIKVLMPIYMLASENFISDEFVRRNHICCDMITPNKGIVTLGGESEVSILHQVTMYVQFGAYCNKVVFNVLKLAPVLTPTRARVVEST